MAPIRAGDFTVTPIVEVNFVASRLTPGLWVCGSIKPVAVVIRHQGHETRLEVAASEPGSIFQAPPIVLQAAQ